MTSKIVIFGGSGFVGSVFSNILYALNIFESVIVVGRSEKPRYKLELGITYLQGNINNSAFVHSLVHDANSIIDLTYATVPKSSFDNPLLETTLNLPASVNLMHICATYNISKYFLVSSGGTVYGNTNLPLIDEYHPTNPISPYGICKLAIEKYANFYFQNFDLPILIARPSNPYGFNQIANSPQGFIGNAIYRLLNNDPLTVYCNEGVIRDYIFIDDLALGLINCLLNGKVGNTYNIGTGIGTSNKKIVDLIESIFEMKFSNLNILEKRTFDVNYNVLNSNKLFNISGWEPQTSLYNGIYLIKSLI